MSTLWRARTHDSEGKVKAPVPGSEGGGRQGQPTIVSRLLDLRPYWLFGVKACRVEQSDPSGALGWLCTLPHGHSGRHVAHDMDATVCATWVAGK